MLTPAQRTAEAIALLTSPRLFAAYRLQREASRLREGFDYDLARAVECLAALHLAGREREARAALEGLIGEEG